VTSINKEVLNMKFYAIGGYNEVGKNMSAVEINGEVVILDMGVYMDKIITLEEEDRKIPTKEMIQCGALPDDHMLEGKNVAAIVLSHGHLDHIAAVPRMAERYKCPIIATPYACEILKNLLKDAGVGYLIKSLFPLSTGETASISSNFEVEFVHMTHSIPHTALIALHTKEGIIAYLNDYKLDNNPTLGEKPDYKRIKQLGKQGVKLLISECVRVADEARTPPEYVAQVLVEDGRKHCCSHNNVRITSRKNKLHNKSKQEPERNNNAWACSKQLPHPCKPSRPDKAGQHKTIQSPEKHCKSPYRCSGKS